MTYILSSTVLRDAKRIVVKVGSSLVTNEGRGLDEVAIGEWCRQMAHLIRDGREVIMVSSGAIAEGMKRLGWTVRPKAIQELQAAAAVGQMGLAQMYETKLRLNGLGSAQVLLTHADLADRERYLNARSTLLTLLKLGVVPVINENDTVVNDEIKFGDNDTLGALVANLVEADALVILSDVDGLYDADPRKHPDARRIEEVSVVTRAMLASAGGSGSAVGTGGMATKLRAAQQVTELGIRCVIAAGQRPGTLTRVFEGANEGTLFEPQEGKRDARHAWIAHALKAKGTRVVDAGARAAVLERKKSLLPSGIREVKGNFSHGDPVDLSDEHGEVFARGLAAYGADELRKLAGKRTQQIEAALGYRGLDEAVHRDDLAML